MNTDEILMIDPFLVIKDLGGSNGQEDVETDRILRTERFYIEMPNSGMIPVRNRHIHIVERLLMDTYGNIHISWMGRLADGSFHSAFHFMGLHETSLKTRMYPGDVVNADGYYIPQESIALFRSNATKQFDTFQRKSLTLNRKKTPRATTFDGTPTDILADA